MPERDNTNRGAIWKNKKKEADGHPDFTGQLNVEGVEYWVSAWKRKEDASPNAPALSFSVKPKEAKPAAAPAPRVAPRTARASQRDDSDPIPF